jgi:ABC-type methionine transport system ATPase subunit
VLVLDQGNIVEFGSLMDLIENSDNGTFRSICQDTGEFEDLLGMAKSGSFAVKLVELNLKFLFDFSVYTNSRSCFLNIRLLHAQQTTFQENPLD